VFEGPDGKRTLAELFGGKSQLLIYHFMFDPAWDAGCKSCSFVADNFAGALVHLAARDTSFAVISRAPLPQIMRFKQRMGWRFPWLSSFGTEFNYDFHVTTDESHTEYNYMDVSAQPEAVHTRANGGLERVRAGGRPGVPHLFGLSARHRSAAQHLQPARPHPARPQRERPDHVVAQVPRPVLGPTMTGMEMHQHTSYGAAAGYVGMWMAMMVPMMLPSLVPMLSRYRRSVRGVGGIHLHGLTALVGAGYFAIWAVLGAVAWTVGSGVNMVEMRWGGWRNGCRSRPAWCFSWRAACSSPRGRRGSWRSGAKGQRPAACLRPTPSARGGMDSSWECGAASAAGA